MSSSVDFPEEGLSEEKAQEKWRFLRDSFESIMRFQTEHLKFEELYRTAYELVLHRYSRLLYGGVKDALTNKMKSLAEKATSTVDENLLPVIDSIWKDHGLKMHMIRDVLMYMDKIYCTSNARPKSYNLSMRLLKEHVLLSSNVPDRLRSLLLSAVDRERRGESIDRALMKRILSMLVSVNINNTELYCEIFETQFLRSTAEFYRLEAQSWAASDPVPLYLRKAERRIREEESRAKDYIYTSSHEKLRNIVYQELVTRYAAQLVEHKTHGCAAMFAADAVDDLARMYRLFRDVPATLKHIQKCLKKVVRETGTAIVKDRVNARNPRKFVLKILDCRKKYENFVVQSFQSHRSFTGCLKSALEYCINLDSRAAEFLSLYVDELMRSDFRKGMGEEDIKNKLSDVVSFFRYIEDKDVFEFNYKKHLAVRLLAGSSDHKYEKMMITKLIAECGHQYTTRLEGMFKDMKISNDMMSSYRERLAASRMDAASKPDEVEICVNVLTSGYWPISAVGEESILPPEAKAATETFDAFYTKKFSGRKLSWLTSHGIAELRIKFDSGDKLLVVHTYQMLILMMFNTKREYTFAEIKKLTKIPDGELRRHLISLAQPKVRVLRKKPDTLKIQPNHVYRLNVAYKNDLHRIKIPLVQMRKKNEAKEAKISQEVLLMRKNRTEAIIVRVMKMRKTLDHHSLIKEVLKQSIRFAVEPAYVKKRIESLIDQEYMTRDGRNRQLYHYVA